MRIMPKIYFFLVCMFSFPLGHAQIILSGKVIDKEKDIPLPHVMVMLKDKSNERILEYSQTDAKGAFILKTTPEIVAKASLHFAIMGYKEQIRFITDDENQLFRVEMEMSEIELKEVVVKSRKIWEQGDTLVYNVASFATEQDRSIGDVLKKMPGFEVKQDGQIYYNGKTINKFYIEGSDLLEGRYGIATQGVPQKKVGRVEVMENHQPIRALQGFTFSDQAAINLKMKDKSKAKWIVTVDASTGTSSLPKGILCGSLFGMMIKSGWQNITIAKSNNTSEDFSIDMRDFSPSSYIKESIFFRTDASRTNNLEKERTMFNRSHLISSNSLWKVAKDTEMKTQIHYLNHRETSHSLLGTTYYLPDGSKVIDENEYATAHSDQLATVVSIESNKTKSYLKNILKADLKWTNGKIETLGTFANNQVVETPVFRANNILQWVKRLKTKAITLTSINEVRSEPHFLTIEQNGLTYRQNANLKAFYTHETTSYGWELNRFVFSLKTGIEAQYRLFSSNLSGIVLSYGSAINDERNGCFRTYAGPELEYKSRKWRSRLVIPLSYYYYTFHNDNESVSDLLLSPSLSVYWDYSKNLTFYANASSGAKPYEFVNRYSGFVLRNYRTLQQGNGEYAIGLCRAVSTGFNYKNSNGGLFGNFNIVRVWNKDPFRDVQQFDDDLRKYGSTRQDTRSDSWFGNGSFSASIDWIRGMAGIDVIYFKSGTLLISEKQITPYQTEMWNFEVNINGQLFSWMNWNYKVSHSLYSLNINKIGRNTLHGWRHNARCNIVPLKKIVFQFSGEYYKNEISPKTYKDFILINTKATYNLSRRLEISVQLRNILNHQRYGYTVYNALSSIKQEHDIRGREFLIGFSWR